MDYLADRTKLIDASGIRKVFALAGKLKDPVNLSIGQPDFDVPDTVKDAAIDAIRKGFNKYSQTAGQEEVIACLKEKVSADYGWDNPPLMITDGVSGGLLLAFMALINPGDEVLVPDPYFVMYKHLVWMLGGTCVYINTYPDFHLSPEKVEAAITGKTKLILLNTPANPTGVVYTQQEVQAIAELAKKNDIIVLSDEIYEEYCYDGPNTSVGTYYDKSVILKGFSKSHATTGWRLGYATCSDKLAPLMEKMLMIQQYTFVCAPTPFQMAVPTMLECDTHAFVDAYHLKRDRVIAGLGKCFEIVKPGGAFYMFIKTPEKYPNASEFVKKAIENNVLIIPGNVFSEQDTHFRLGYVAPDEKLDQGIDILCKLAK